VEAVGKQVSLRDTPSANGKIVTQKISDYSTNFVVESSPIRDDSDNSFWYKIIFNFDEAGGDIHLTTKKASFNFSNPYISAESTKKVPFTQDEKLSLQWFCDGRPPIYKTGDVLWGDMDDYKIVPLKKKLTLYSEPDERAKMLHFKKGTKIKLPALGLGGCFPSIPEIVKGYNGDFFYHIDVNDVFWRSVVGEDGRIIGWLQGRK
jgi:hypothetical protein